MARINALLRGTAKLPLAAWGLYDPNHPKRLSTPYARSPHKSRLLGQEDSDWHSCPGDVHRDVLIYPAHDTPLPLPPLGFGLGLGA